MRFFYFTSTAFQLEPLEQRRADSEGWGMEFARWLQPQLQAAGYTVRATEPDTLGWRMVLQTEPFKLWVTCIAAEAEVFNNFEELGLKADDVLWECFGTSVKPFLKSLFNKIDDEPTLDKLALTLRHILSAEPGISFVPAPP